MAEQEVDRGVERNLIDEQRKWEEGQAARLNAYEAEVDAAIKALPPNVTFDEAMTAIQKPLMGMMGMAYFSESPMEINFLRRFRAKPKAKPPTLG